MSLSYSVQSQIAFKNINGISQTDPSKGVLNEFYGSSFNIPSNLVWTDTISEDPTFCSLQSVTVEVIADLELIPGTNKHSYITKWPINPPSGIDYKTGLTFSYGYGSLATVAAGDRMMNIISPYFGFSYSVIPYTIYPNNKIPFLDPRDWIYQYNSGIFYQNNITGLTPSNIVVYPYIGNSFNISTTYENIRITATGTNQYYSSDSFPNINSYSTNYLFLVDFVNLTGFTNSSGISKSLELFDFVDLEDFVD